MGHGRFETGHGLNPFLDGIIEFIEIDQPFWKKKQF